jgi:hypothetical protein
VDRKTRGLPESFELDVPQSAISGPVQLGDYLDEEDTPLPARKPREAAVRERNVVEMPRRERNDERGEILPKPTAPSQSAQTRKTPPKPRRVITTVLRKQVNMTPETLQMVDELLNYVQTYSVQTDTRASELFHALVLSLYEARENLDLSKVPPRGRWGTPTASAFPVALKNAIQLAIVKDYYEKQQ